MWSPSVYYRQTAPILWSLEVDPIVLLTGPGRLKFSESRIGETKLPHVLPRLYTRELIRVSTTTVFSVFGLGKGTRQK